MHTARALKCTVSRHASIIHHIRSPVFERAFVARNSSRISCRLAIASAVYRPCLSACLLPFGAPGESPPCIRHRPFFIAGDWHGLPRRVRARHRGARCIGKCMGLFLRFPYDPPRLSTLPTMAWAPSWTWTCSTVTFCWPPLPRWRLSASSRTA
jgi:hypothetical protein